MKRVLISVLCILAAVFIYAKQQEELKKIEQEFKDKVVEVNNFKFDIPAMPEKDSSITLAENALRLARRQAVSADIKTSMEAIEKLWKMQDETAIPSIKKVMSMKCRRSQGCNQVEQHKLAVVEFIGREQTKINLKLLQTAASDLSPAVRKAAALAMGEYLTKDVLSPLQLLTVDKDSGVSSQAWESMEKVSHSMSTWKKDQVNALVSEYAKKISRGDTVSAEKKLRRIARRIDKETEEAKKEKKGGNAK